jgi:hypothetical protein
MTASRSGRQSASERARGAARTGLVGALLALAACAGEPTGDAWPATASSAAPRPTACDEEMRAFVAVSQLAKKYRGDWRLFEPAIDAMRDQILDCVDDSYPGSVGL